MGMPTSPTARNCSGLLGRALSSSAVIGRHHHHRRSTQIMGKLRAATAMGWRNG